MAKIREPEKPVSSDPEEEEEEEDEEEDDEEEEEESSGDDDDEEEPPLYQISKKPSSSLLKKPQSSSKTQPDSSSSSSDDDDDSSDESDDGPLKNVKPMDDKPKPNPKGKAAAEPTTPVKSPSAAAKREKEAAEKANKKKKDEPESSAKAANESSKKVLFQRLWSEEDEIVILKGILDYTAKYKSPPSAADIDAFHDFIRKNLHIDVSKTQLQDKMRRLKKKYENNKSKEKGGKDRSFSKAHEQKAYELSKKIWGIENNGKGNEGEKVVVGLGSLKANGGGTGRKASSKRLLELANVAENGEAKDGKDGLEVSRGGVEKPASSVKRVRFDGASGHERVLRIGAELFEWDAGVEGQDEWKKLLEDELELYVKQLDLMRAQAKLVLDAVKSNAH